VLHAGRLGLSGRWKGFLVETLLSPLEEANCLFSTAWPCDSNGQDAVPATLPWQRRTMKRAAVPLPGGIKRLKHPVRPLHMTPAYVMTMCNRVAKAQCVPVDV
jgi:hypothetical protein